MKRILLILLPLIAFTGHVQAEVGFARITVERNEKRPQIYQVVIRNISEKPMSYLGLEREVPYIIEIQKDQKWITKNVAWGGSSCATGLGPRQLAPKKALTSPLFHYALSEIGEGNNFRVSFVASEGEKSRWNRKAEKVLYSPIYVLKDGKIEKVVAAKK